MIIASSRVHFQFVSCASSNILLSPLLSKSEIAVTEITTVCKVGSVFGFQILNGFQYETGSNEISYPDIFKAQQEEYFNKVYGHPEIANHIIKVADKPKKHKLPSFLNDFLYSDKESDALITCEECGRNFNDQETFKSHTETVHKPIERPTVKPFACKYCSKTFSYAINVKRHIFLVHPLVKDSYEDPQPFSFNDTDMPENNPGEDSNEVKSTTQSPSKPSFPELEKFKCKICGEFLKSKRYLVAHIQSHYGGGYKCDYPGCTSVFR